MGAQGVRAGCTLLIEMCAHVLEDAHRSQDATAARRDKRNHIGTTSGPRTTKPPMDRGFLPWAILGSNPWPTGSLGSPTGFRGSLRCAEVRSGRTAMVRRWSEALDVAHREVEQAMDALGVGRPEP